MSPRTKYDARDDILSAINREREYQDENWGSEFDDANTVNDWITYVNIYMARAAVMTATVENQKIALTKSAALLVAALEALDRNNEFAPRHYEWLVPSTERPMGEYPKVTAVKQVDPKQVVDAARQAIDDAMALDTDVLLEEIPRLIGILRVVNRTLKETQKEGR